MNDTIGLANLQKNEICFYVTSDSNTYTLKNVSGLSSTKDFAYSLIRAKAEKIKCTENQFGILFDSRQQTAEEAGTVNTVWNGQGDFKDFLEDIKNTLTLFSSVKISSILVFPQNSKSRDNIREITDYLGYSLDEKYLDERVKMSKMDIEILLSSDKTASISKGLISPKEYEIIQKEYEIIQKNPSYIELLEAGKKFEEQKKYFYALATWYEASKIEQNKGISGNGVKNYTELENIIQKGLPGKEEYDEFSIRDGWIELIKDAERYFSEYPTFEMYFKPIKRGDLNYEKKTASYYLPVIFIRDKYEALVRGVLIRGLNNYDRSQIRIPKIWCNYDIKKYGYTDNKSSIVNVENLIRERTDKIYPEIKTKLIPEVEKIYKEEKIALFIKDGNSAHIFYCLDNLACFEKIPDVREGYARNFLSFYDNAESLYEVKFGLFDKDGNLIRETPRQSLSTRNSLFAHYDDSVFGFGFGDFSSENMKKLDNGEYTVKLLGLWLRYGVFDTRSNQIVASKDITKEELKKNLSEIQLDLSKVTFGAWTTELENKYSGWGK